MTLFLRKSTLATILKIGVAKETSFLSCVIINSQAFVKSDPLPLNNNFCLFSKLLITDSRSVRFYSKITQQLTFNENASILNLVFSKFDFIS